MGLRWRGGCSLLLHDINDITLVISLLLHNGYYQVVHVLVCVWLSLWIVYKTVGCFSCILNNFIIRIYYRFFFPLPLLCIGCVEQNEIEQTWYCINFEELCYHVTSPYLSPSTNLTTNMPCVIYLSCHHH